MKERRMTKAENADFYAKMESRHPEQAHILGDNPQTVPLLSCGFCGSRARPVFVHALYGCPCYVVRCECCGKQTKPEPWGVLILYTKEPEHIVTEREALQKACDKWNAEQARREITMHSEPVPAAVSSGRCKA